MPKQRSISLPVARTDAFQDAGRPAARSCEPAEAHPDEFARSSSAPPGLFSRRDFLTYSSATLALAGLTGCSDRPTEAIVPYVDLPEQVTPGEPQFFATTLTRNGYGRGVIVTSREGRPVKIEGNPDHPASLGAADAQMQAAILDLYDPRRSKAVTHAGRPSTWGAFVTKLRERIQSHEADGGRGLVILSEQSTSPTLKRLRSEWNEKFPNMTWLVHQPTGSGTNARKAFRSTAQNQPGTETIYHVSKADVIVSFASDFLWELPGSLAYARRFAERRRVYSKESQFNRLYVAEADFSITGTKADHRLAVRPTRMAVLVRALRAQIGAGGRMPTDLSSLEAAWLSAVATDLNAARGRGLVVIGEDCPAELHALGDVINRHFGNAGQTVRRVQGRALNLIDESTGEASLYHLADSIPAGGIRTLLVLADNPVRTAPGNLPLAKLLTDLSQRSDAFTAHLGLYANETAYVCQWHAPATHELEQWGDATAFDGTTSIIQPLISPLTGGHSTIELLNAALGIERSAYETVRQTWRERDRGGSNPEFERFWSDALRSGVAEKPEPFDAGGPVEPVEENSAVVQGFDLLFRPDSSIGDGSQYHNPWLQELPRPMTKIVWGNAALISPKEAARLGVGDEEVLKIAAGDRSVELSILIQPGIADGTIVLHLGYGEHKATGSEVKPFLAGVDVYPLKAGTAGWATGATVTPTGRRQAIVRTHNHHSMAADAGRDVSVSAWLAPQVIATPKTSVDELARHNRKLIRTATVDQFSRQPNFAQVMSENEIHQLYPAWDYSHGPQWGMTIDLTTCIGCNACIVACQAENNIPSVGPEEVSRQREMHWLRVDQYMDEGGRVHHQPVPCMHCENAPCEYVCPVAATTHSTEGLNQMTYNRCVGTRYCSNNCPYKVRRFNFFNYTAPQPNSFAMQRNPDVTVRTRGVMEKCTYCVQRIVYADRKAEIAALNADEDQKQLVRRDLISRLQTACQQTCPTNAIQFGDLTNPDAPVTRSKQSPRNYGVLTELSTKPRTTYLASISNPSPMLGGDVG